MFPESDNGVGPKPGDGWERCHCDCHRAGIGKVMHCMPCCQNGWKAPLFPIPEKKPDNGILDLLENAKIRQDNSGEFHDHSSEWAKVNGDRYSFLREPEAVREFTNVWVTPEPDPNAFFTLEDLERVTVSELPSIARSDVVEAKRPDATSNKLHISGPFGQFIGKSRKSEAMLRAIVDSGVPADQIVTMRDGKFVKKPPTILNTSNICYLYAIPLKPVIALDPPLEESKDDTNP